MRPIPLFVLMQIAVLILSTPLATEPSLQEYKPEVLTDEAETDVLNITSFLLIGTALLILIKTLGISLQFLIETSVFISGIYFSVLTGIPILGIPIGLILLAMRRTDNITLFNAATAICVLTFSILFGAFLSYETSLLLLGAISLYDALAVLYTKHMKFLWFRQKLDRFRRSLVFLFPRGDQFSIIGSGDFALPLLFTVTLTTTDFISGAIAAIFGTLGFLLLEAVCEKTDKIKDTGLPGIPFIAVSCAVGALLASTFRPI